MIFGCGGQTAARDEESSAVGASKNTAEQAQADLEEKSGQSPEEDGGTPQNGEGQHTPVDVSNPVVHGSSYVAPLVEIFRDVRIGEHSFVASNTNKYGPWCILLGPELSPELPPAGGWCCYCAR
jgi:hypothetical protein